MSFGFVGGPTQSVIPDAADEMFVSALANEKVYLAYGSIAPKVEGASCLAACAGYNKKAEDADNKFRSNQIDRKA